jgi:hypothetical protein
LSRERPQLVEASIEVVADRVEELRHVRRTKCPRKLAIEPGALRKDRAGAAACVAGEDGSTVRTHACAP